MESYTFYRKFGECHNHLSTQDGAEKNRAIKPADKARNVTVWSPAVRDVLSKKTNTANQNRLALEKPAHETHGEDSKKRNETINWIIKRDSHFFRVRRLWMGERVEQGDAEWRQYQRIHFNDFTGLSLLALMIIHDTWCEVWIISRLSRAVKIGKLNRMWINSQNSSWSLIGTTLPLPCGRPLPTLLQPQFVPSDTLLHYKNTHLPLKPLIEASR